MSGGDDGGAGPIRLWQVASLLTTLRRDRAEQLGPDLFADPAWELLLAAYVLEAEGRPTDAMTLAAATTVPLRVAQRWLNVLIERGLIEPEAPDDADLRLSGSAQRAMERHFDRIARSLSHIASQA